MTTTVREQVREYLTRMLRETKDDTQPLADSDSLVLSGRLSSLDVVDVLMFLEGTFNFSMDPNEFDQAKFDSVDRIVQLIEASNSR
jgi:acyl carrier protein